MPGPGQRLRAIEERLDILEANQGERYMEESAEEIELPEVIDEIVNLEDE